MIISEMQIKTSIRHSKNRWGKTGICSLWNMPDFHGADIIRIRIDFCAKKVYLIDAGRLYVLPDFMI